MSGDKEFQTVNLLQFSTSAKKNTPILLCKNYLYILKNMYIIVKKLSKGSKKNTKKTYFI